MSLVTRKPVFGVCDQGRLKPACTATAVMWRLEILDIETRGIKLHVSKQRTTKVLIRLYRSAGWSVPLLFAYGISRFFHDVAHMFSDDHRHCGTVHSQTSETCRFSRIFPRYYQAGKSLSSKTSRFMCTFPFTDKNIAHTTCIWTRSWKKPVFGVCNQVRHKPACTATEAS